MPAQLRLVGGDIVELGDVPITDGVGRGETLLVTLENCGTTNLRGIIVGLKGEGAPFVQLAAKNVGDDKVWAEPGREIIAMEGTLFVGEDRWRSSLTVDEIGVPTAVEEVLVNRVGRLSDEAAQVNAADPTQVALVYTTGVNPTLRLPAQDYQLVRIGVYDLYLP